MTDVEFMSIAVLNFHAPRLMRPAFWRGGAQRSPGGTLVVNNRFAGKAVCTLVPLHTGMSCTEDPRQSLKAAVTDDFEPVVVEVLQLLFHALMKSTAVVVFLPQNKKN